MPFLLMSYLLMLMLITILFLQVSFLQITYLYDGVSGEGQTVNDYFVMCHFCVMVFLYIIY